MTHEFTETHPLQQISVHSPHNYKLLRDDDAFSAFLIESAGSIVGMRWSSVNPAMLPIEEFCKLSPYRQFHEDCLERYSHNLPPPNGRIRDAYLAAAKHADDHDGRWTVYFDIAIKMSLCTDKIARECRPIPLSKTLI